MIELLDRNEIPIQPLRERNDGIDPIVPVHLGITALSADAKKNGLDLAAAKVTVEEWYNEDMVSYLSYLREQGYDLRHLRGYEEFDVNWTFDAELSESKTGFLRLIWKEDGQIHKLIHDATPVPYRNLHDENGNFYTPEVFQQKRVFPIIYRHLGDPIFLFMEPDKIKYYGAEVPEVGIIIDPVGGIAEVLGTSFDTEDYIDNFAKALVLRNFGVAYLNQLVAYTEGVSAS